MPIMVLWQHLDGIQYDILLFNCGAPIATLVLDISLPSSQARQKDGEIVVFINQAGVSGLRIFKSL